jgi:hypothetical protein
MRTVISRIGAMFRRRRLDAEMDEELRAHLEMAAAEHRRRGLSEEDARRAALRDFGGLTQVRETVRGARRIAVGGESVARRSGMRCGR